MSLLSFLSLYELGEAARKFKWDFSFKCFQTSTFSILEIVTTTSEKNEHISKNASTDELTPGNKSDLYLNWAEDNNALNFRLWYVPSCIKVFIKSASSNAMSWHKSLLESISWKMQCTQLVWCSQLQPWSCLPSII